MKSGAVRAPTEPDESYAYAPGLDGLRALAVLAVLAFHGGLPFARGGFLGVSLFFTLSGFLITRLLLAEWRGHERIALRDFWERRLRRLAPAALLTLAAVAIAAPHFMDPVSRAPLRGDELAAFAYVANWRFLLHGQHYADLFRTPSPVLHFWSLAIEEQFYIVFPLVVAAVLRVSRGSRRALGITLTLLLLASVAAQLAYHRVDRVYFGTDTRAAELLAGALLAIVLSARPVARRVALTAGCLSLGVFAVLAATLSVRSPFLAYGGLAGIALVNVGLVTAAVAGVGIGRALSWRPLTAIGAVSYGLYLVHWPVFLWMDERRTGLHGAQLAVARLAVVGVITVVSYHLLESPVRFRHILRTRRQLLPVVAAAAACGVWFVATMPIGRVEPLTDPSVLRAITARAPRPRPAPLRVMLVGDRTAEHLVLGLRGEPRNVIVDDETRADCVTVAAGDLGVLGLAASRPASGCPHWRTSWARRAREFRPDLVVVRPSRDDLDLHDIASGARADPGRRFWALGEAYHAVTAVLRSSGAVVAWSTLPTDQLETLPGADDPQVRAAYLTSERDAIVSASSDRLGVVGVDDRTFTDSPRRAADALWQAYRAGNSELGRAGKGDPRAAPVRVLLAGDSTSLNLAAGLGEHGRAHGDLVVDWAGQEACPLAQVARFREVGDTVPYEAAGCRSFPSVWKQHIARFHPDLILVVASFMDAADLARMPGGSWEHLGEPGYDAYYASTLDTAVRVARRAHVRLAFATAPLEDARTVGSTNTLHDRLGVLNSQLTEMLRRDPYVALVPLAAHVDRPDGVVDRRARPDGVHFTVGASRALADGWLARELVALVNS